MTKRRLITETYTGKVQHTRPCSDCPWARTALHGWLGNGTSEEWVHIAHRDDRVDCHVIVNMQCAGLAVYRANVCKSPRDPKILKLAPDRERVFATPFEFLEHHSEKNFD